MQGGALGPNSLWCYLKPPPTSISVTVLVWSSLVFPSSDVGAKKGFRRGNLRGLDPNRGDLFNT
jgi:hypothetical protein